MRDLFLRTGQLEAVHFFNGISSGHSPMCLSAKFIEVSMDHLKLCVCEENLMISNQMTSQ